jgi:D-amino-acid dehydrogenase
MGARPCKPDMMPIIGKAPRHNGLWFAFGHAHHGLTLGPVTGRVLAELITGETPFIDISAYSPQRFNA